MYLLILLLIQKTIPAAPAVGDTFIVRAVYSDITGMSGGGTEAREVVDSISLHGDTTRYFFTIISAKTDGFFESGRIMQPLIKANNTRLTMLGTKPVSITGNSAKFDNSAWILGEKSDFLFFPDLQPVSQYLPMPLVRADQLLENGDFYRVRVSDTMGILWTCDVLQSRSFIGKYFKYRNRSDTVGMPIPDTQNYFVCGNTPSWRYTGGPVNGSNPFCLIEINASSSTYPLKNSAMTVGEGCYGMRMSGYRPVQTAVKNGAMGTAGDFSMCKETCCFYDLFGRKISLDQKKLRSINVLVQRTDRMQRTRGSVFRTVADIFR